MKLFEWAETDRLRKAFRWVETDFEFETLEKYKVDIADKFEVGDYTFQVEAYFEEVGFLVNKKFVDIDAVVDRLGGHIIQTGGNEPRMLTVARQEMTKL
jgi:hypothetical protein